MPAKLWAIVIPLLLPFVVVVYVGGVFLRNCVVLRGVFDSVEVSIEWKRSDRLTVEWFQGNHET